VERAEAAEPDGLAAAQRILDRGERGIERPLCGGAGELAVGRDAVDQLASIHGFQASAERGRDATPRQAPRCSQVSLSRIGWMLTTAAFLVIGLVLLLENYQGYPALALAIAIAAAINLR
jgi:hypothetical protein